MSSPSQVPSLTQRFRALSFSSPTPQPPSIRRMLPVAAKIDPVNDEFCQIIHDFTRTPKIFTDDDMQVIIQGPTDQILQHCNQHMSELTGEALLLRFWTIHYLRSMFTPGVDCNQLLYESLCTIAESFFQQSHSDRFDSLYGDIAWFHDTAKEAPNTKVDFALNYAKSEEQNGSVHTAIEPQLTLCDAQHPWHLKKLPNRSIVHDWYALCYWLMKLTPLRAPRGSAQATDQLHCIFAAWVNKTPHLSAKTIVHVGAGLSLIATYLEPDKLPAQRSPRTPRRTGSTIESVNPFVKLCRELNTLDFNTWMAHGDAKLITQMAMNRFNAKTTLQVLGFLHNEQPHEGRYEWLTRIDSVESNRLLTLIQNNEFENDTLYEFFTWITWGNQSFSIRLNIAQAILTRLKTRKASMQEIHQFFIHLLVFFEQAEREGYFSNDSLKQLLKSLVESLFDMPWHFQNAQEIFCKGNSDSDIPQDLQDILKKITQIESTLYPSQVLQERFYEKCITLLAQLAKTDTTLHSDLKAALLKVCVSFHNKTTIVATRKKMLPEIREIAQSTGDQGLGITFDEMGGLIISKINF